MHTVLRLRHVLVLSILLVGPAAGSEAEYITFAFDGQVTSSNKTGVFPLGQSVSGSYTFDSTTPDDNPGNTEQGVYSPIIDFGPPPAPPEKGVTHLSFTSGGYSATAVPENSGNGGGEILVNRDSFFDPHQYSVFFIRSAFGFPSSPPMWGPNVDDEQLVRMLLLLEDATGTAIASIALPLTPPDLADFTSATFNLFFESDATSPPGGVVFSLHSLTLVPEPPIAVEIHIKPGNDRNPVNPTSRGVIPVAILGSDTFDANDVDVTTLAFGPNGAALAHRNGPHMKDANHDGVDDLLAHFLIEASGIAFGDTEACVTGETLDGTSFEGCDAISTEPPCGTGFEAALLLPPLLWGRRRLRRRPAPRAGFDGP